MPANPPAYVLCHRIGPEVYILTWTRATRPDALDTIYDWAVDTGECFDDLFRLLMDAEREQQTRRMAG